MSISNGCFLTCIQVSQEAGKVVWYSYLVKNFPQFVVICTVKGFSIVNEAEIDVFLEFYSFLYDPVDVGDLISGSSAFSKSHLCIWKFLSSHTVEDFPSNGNMWERRNKVWSLQSQKLVCGKSFWWSDLQIINRGSDSQSCLEFLIYHSKPLHQYITYQYKNCSNNWTDVIKRIDDKLVCDYLRLFQVFKIS